MVKLAPRARWLLGGALAVVVLAGGWLVVRHDSTGEHGPPRAGVVDSKVGLQPLVARHWDRARLLTVAQTEPSDVDSTPWVLSSSTGRTVRIIYAVGSGSCERSRGVYVDETADRVLVGTYVRHLAGPGDACTADLRIGDARVRLRAPLGDRPLVHAVVTWGQEMAAQLTG